MFQHVGLFCSCEGKFCNQCGQVKCHRAFHKDRTGSFGLRWRCKDCQRKYVEENNAQINERRREYNAERRDHFNEYRREHYRKNPEPKNAYDRKYRQENATKIKAYIREYKRTNEAYQEKKRESYREYMRLHPEKSAEYFHNRRAREQQATGSFTSREWKKLCKHYNYTCLHCGKREPEIKLTVDHVIPLSVGGTNSIDNIQPLCQSCNSSKGITIADYRANWG
jgi:5-methylcytosine-specific restriction endonuclease McrA